MNFKEEIFGKYRGNDVKLITVRNDNGIEFKVMNYGATITSLIVPDKYGKKDNIVCGFDKFESYFQEEYIKNAPYFGCIVGRYTGRIKNANFEINGVRYNLNANDGPNHIHGGKEGFDKKVWKVLEIKQTDNEICIKFYLFSKDGEEGYPGNVEVIATYGLNNRNELFFEYQGKTDKATPLSLTNHTYFNLNGFKSTIHDHIVQINSSYILKVDETNVPTGERIDVKGTYLDLRKPRLLIEVFKEAPEGFEDYYVLNEEYKSMKQAAVISHPESGRSLDVYTTEPGFLFYTGRYTSDNLKREDGTCYGRFRAFCCETSRFPNGPNIGDSPGSILYPNEEYHSRTIFKFTYT